MRTISINYHYETNNHFFKPTLNDRNDWCIIEKTKLQVNNSIIFWFGLFSSLYKLVDQWNLVSSHVKRQIV